MNRAKAEKIILTDSDIDIESCDSSCSFLLTLKCPDCGMRVTWTEYQYWDSKCDCRNWEFEIKAIGTLIAKQGAKNEQSKND